MIQDLLKMLEGKIERRKADVKKHKKLRSQFVPQSSGYHHNDKLVMVDTAMSGELSFLKGWIERRLSV